MPFAPASLSGAVNGKVIYVRATTFLLTEPNPNPSSLVAHGDGYSGTPIHQAVAGTETWDEVWLWAANTDTQDRSLTIGWGAAAGVVHTEFAFQSTIIPALSLSIAVIEGLRIQNSLFVSAIGTATNKFVITGYVNRITPDE